MKKILLIDDSDTYCVRRPGGASIPQVMVH